MISDISCKIEPLQKEVYVLRNDTVLIKSVIEEMRLEMKHLFQLAVRREEKLDLLLSYLSEETHSRSQATRITAANAKQALSPLTPPDSPGAGSITPKESSITNMAAIEALSAPQLRLPIADSSSFSFGSRHEKNSVVSLVNGLKPVSPRPLCSVVRSGIHGSYENGRE